MEILMDWVLLICCVPRISAHGTLFSAFYGPPRPLDLTSSSTATTTAPTSSSTPQYSTPTIGTQISRDDLVVSTVYVTTSTTKTTTTNTTSTTTPMTYPFSSISTLTSTGNPTDFDQQLNTSMELNRTITCNSTSVWPSSTATVVENVSNKQSHNDDYLDTLVSGLHFAPSSGGLITGSVVGAFILLLACIAVCIFVGHRRNTEHGVRPDDDHYSVYVNHYVIPPSIVYKL